MCRFHWAAGSYAVPTRSGSFATLAAIRRAWLFGDIGSNPPLIAVSNLAADRRARFILVIVQVAGRYGRAQ
jgi:hypothetical protein